MKQRQPWELILNLNKFSDEGEIKMTKVVTQEIGFKVTDFEMAKKNGCAVVHVMFDSHPEKDYKYIRAYSKTSDGVYKVQIDGCAVSFRLNLATGKWEAISYKRLHDTTKKKKLKTEKIGNKSFSKTEEEIKAPKVESGEVHHDRYEEIKMCLECNIPVYLAGPAGSGKNHTVEQIAKELGWNFYFSNSVQQEYKLTGFIDAGGKFHETEFYKACTDDKDCVFFLDEMDASIPEVLVLLNAAIANGYFEFPNGRVDFSHVHFVAAGNTVGSGADDMYTGRMVLDQATLDRFAIIEFDYCLKVEMAISKNNASLVTFIRQMRKEAENKGIRATFSYRCITMLTKLEESGMNLEMAIKISVVKGLDKDTINTLNPTGHSKYHEAFKKVKMAA